MRFLLQYELSDQEVVPVQQHLFLLLMQEHRPLLKSDQADSAKYLWGYADYSRQRLALLRYSDGHQIRI